MSNSITPSGNNSLGKKWKRSIPKQEVLEAMFIKEPWLAPLYKYQNEKQTKNS
ncbi:MAG: hypothetical protein ACD_19C00187G0020 [uncultured bacterium]|nr:MAG: hypothetical protein ACD_19C00187G0020 [uncultured bacterium]